MFSLSFRVTEDNLQQMGDTLEMAVISVLFRKIILYIQRFYAGYHKQNKISFSIIN